MLPPSPKLAYRDADYDTAGGVASSRPRPVGVVVDMQRHTGRGLTPAGGAAEEEKRHGDCSHGGEGNGKERRGGRGADQRARRRVAISSFVPPPLSVCLCFLGMDTVVEKTGDGIRHTGVARLGSCDAAHHDQRAGRTRRRNRNRS